MLIPQSIVDKLERLPHGSIAWRNALLSRGPKSRSKPSQLKHTGEPGLSVAPQWQRVLARSILLWLFGVIPLVILGGMGHAQEPQPEGDLLQSGEASAVPSPAAQAILATNPTLPWEWARAARILADLQEIEIAKGFLKKILLHLDRLDEAERRATLVDFEARFGAQMFYEMASRPELNPEARLLAEALGLALDAHRRDLTRLRQLVTDLASEDVKTTLRAGEELRRCGGYAVLPLLEGLAKAPNGTTWRRRIGDVFRALGSEVIGPLCAILQHGPPGLARSAAELAGTLRLQAATSCLLGPAYLSPDEDLRLAAQKALGQLYGQVPGREACAHLLVGHLEVLLARAAVPEEDPTSEMWVWDEKTGSPTVVEISARQVALRQALHLGSVAAQLAPENALAQLLWALAEAEHLAGQGSLREIADAVAKLENSWAERSSGELLQVFGLSRQYHLPAGGTVALAVLARRQANCLLAANHIQPSLIVEGLRHPDRRLRFFALLCVIGHAQDCHFAGASWLGEAISFFLASEGKNRVLLAMPSASEAMQMASFFVKLGYEVEVARSGKETFRMLTTSPDFEFVFLDMGISDPPAEVLLQQLAADCRSAPVPIAVLARAGTLDRAERLTTKHPAARAFYRPHSLDSIKWQLGELGRYSRGSLLSPEERTYVVQTLLDVLAADVNRSAQIVPLTRLESVLVRQLNFPDRASAAITLLGSVGTASSQSTLVQFATRQDPPLDLRRKAVEAFRESVARHGLLLTTKQIVRQYDLYNQLGPTSPVEREILGAVLDALEEAPVRAAFSPVTSEGF